jgi:hypothetical protein
MTADAMTVLARTVVVQLREALEHGSISGVIAAGRQLDHLAGYSPALAAQAFRAACKGEGRVTT